MDQQQQQQAQQHSQQPQEEDRTSSTSICSNFVSSSPVGNAPKTGLSFAELDELLSQELSDDSFCARSPSPTPTIGADSCLSLPSKPILKSRIPKDLQQVFLASNRGEEVNEPPKSGTAFKVFRRKFFPGRRLVRQQCGRWRQESVKSIMRNVGRRLSFGTDYTYEFDQHKPPSDRSERTVPLERPTSPPSCRWQAQQEPVLQYHQERRQSIPRRPQRRYSDSSHASDNDVQDRLPKVSFAPVSFTQVDAPRRPERRNSNSSVAPSSSAASPDKENLGGSPRFPIRQGSGRHLAIAAAAGRGSSSGLCPVQLLSKREEAPFALEVTVSR